MEDVANKNVSYLDENISDSSGGNANALVRFYKTHPAIGWARASWTQPSATTQTA